MLQFKKMQMNFISFYFLVLFYLSINPSSDHLFMHSFIYLYGRSFVQFLLSFCLFIFCRSFFIYHFFIIIIFLNLLLAFYISKRKQTLFYHCKSYSIVRALQHFTRLPLPLFPNFRRSCFRQTPARPVRHYSLYVHVNV